MKIFGAVSFWVCIIIFAGIMPLNVKADDYSDTSEHSILKDDDTLITYYLESDKKYITAKKPDGQILWRSNPYLDAKLSSPRSPSDVTITHFSFIPKEWWKPYQALGRSEDFISIGFSDLQAGVIDKRSGKFISLGSD